MIKRKKKLFNLLFLFLFLAVTLFINFFHTEKTPKDDQYCPACRFQHSSLASNTINFFNLPQLLFLEILKSLESSSCLQIFSIDLAPRGPPQV